METTNMIFNIITTIATCFMAFVAWFALKTWRNEFIGKKKIELAAEIMETVCEIQDLIIGARLRVYAREELKEVSDWMNSEKIRDPKNTEFFSDRLELLIPSYRISQGQDKIDKLRGLMNKSYLYWDMDIMKQIQALIDYTFQIRQASKNLYYGDFPEEHSEFLAILYYNGSNDALFIKVNNIVEEFKFNLEFLYKDKQTSWKKLNLQNG